MMMNPVVLFGILCAWIHAPHGAFSQTTAEFSQTTSGLSQTTSGISEPTSGTSEPTWGLSETTSGLSETTSGLSETTSESYLTTSELSQTASGLQTTSTPELTCPGDWTLDRAMKKCYRLFAGNGYNRYKPLKNWANAQGDCQAYGGDLVSIHNNQTENIINSIMSRTTPSARVIWIGLSKPPDEPNFPRWSDGSVVNFNSWHPGQPDAGNRDENCVLYERFEGGQLYGKNALWLHDSCWSARDYMCQIPTNTPLPNITRNNFIISHSCYQDWLHHNGTCFLVVTIPMKWFESMEYCKRLGADLASIHDENENDFLHEKITAMNRIPKFAWIGLYELILTGYRWSDETAANFINWRRGDSNDNQGSGTCVGFEPWSGGWVKMTCNQFREFICKKRNDMTKSTEMPVTNPTISSQTYCSSGFIPIGQKCYILVKELANYKTALKRCANFGKGYNVASFNSYYEMVTLLQNIPTSHAFFIGLRRKWINQDPFIWQDGSSATFFNWGHKAPKYHGSSTCVECINTDDFLSGEWFDIDCSQTRYFLCQGPRDQANPPPAPPRGRNPCKAGYQHNRDSCYKFDGKLRSWDQASKFCRSDGGNLVSIRTHHEFYFVYKLLFDSMPANGTKVWIGLNDKTHPGTYHWSDHWHVMYTNWAYGVEPGRGEKKGCVAVDRSTGKWSDIRCAYTLPAVCKISSAVPPPLPTIHPGNCDDGWIPFESHCYKISPSLVSFYHANSLCSEEGAKLASIHSEAQNAFLLNTVKNWKQDSKFWIGLYRGRGGLAWLDYSPVSFTKWAKNEGRNTYGEYCTELDRSRMAWNDRDCNKVEGYICMKEENKDPASSQAKDGSANHVNVGVVVGVCGGVLLLIVLVAAAVTYWKRKHPGQSASDNIISNVVFCKPASGADHLVEVDMGL